MQSVGRNRARARAPARSTPAPPWRRRRTTMAIDESVAAKVSPKQVIAEAKKLGVKIIDFRFIDLPGTWQHFTFPLSELTEDRLRGGPRLRRLEHPRLPEDPRERHAAHPGSRTRAISTPASKCRRSAIVCDINDPITARALQPRPALHRQEGRGLPAQDRHRRHLLLGPRGGVLHLQRRPLRPERPRGLLLHRLRGGHLEQRAGTAPRQPRLPAPPQGRLLPGAAARQAAGPAQPR